MVGREIRPRGRGWRAAFLFQAFRCRLRSRGWPGASHHLEPPPRTTATCSTVAAARVREAVLAHRLVHVAELVVAAQQVDPLRVHRLEREEPAYVGMCMWRPPTSVASSGPERRPACLPACSPGFGRVPLAAAQPHGACGILVSRLPRPANTMALHAVRCGAVRCGAVRDSHAQPIPWRCMRCGALRCGAGLPTRLRPARRTARRPRAGARRGRPSRR